MMAWLATGLVINVGPNYVAQPLKSKSLFQSFSVFFKYNFWIFVRLGLLFFLITYLVYISCQNSWKRFYLALILNSMTLEVSPFFWTNQRFISVCSAFLWNSLEFFPTASSFIILDQRTHTYHNVESSAWRNE
jgi:hypothetical protein